jgi:drug/metabolite transporter (DMT)-like permease
MSTHSGILFALLSAVLFGASTPLAKALLGEVSPWLLAGLLYLGSGIGLGVVRSVSRLRGDTPGEASLTRADLPWLAAVVLAACRTGVFSQAFRSMVAGMAETPDRSFSP